jgi:hypothetical protein
VTNLLSNDDVYWMVIVIILASYFVLVKYAHARLYVADENVSNVTDHDGLKTCF